MIDFWPPGDHFRLEEAPDEVVEMASSIWSSCGAPTNAPASFRVTTHQFGCGPGDESERWEVKLPRFQLDLGEHLHIEMDAQEAWMEARISLELLASDPAAVSRLLLETPAAILLAHRGWIALHGAAICGPRGAVVVRGANGAGKSTLTAAAAAAGMPVFGDESVLVERGAGSRVTVAVHEVLIRPDVARLLQADQSLGWTSGGGEQKLRVPPGPALGPDQRVAPHLATVLLGDREMRGGARLRELDETAFRAAFPAGEIAQERWSGSPEAIAASWSKRPTYCLDGYVDLSGALHLIETLVREGRAQP